MTDYIKLAEAPTFVFQNPTCGSCSVELECDGDGWGCPCCGTSWDSDASDGDTGELYESWSGETLDSETVSEDAAYDAGRAHKRAADKKLYASWGWCEHGFPGKCWISTCPGGKKASLQGGESRGER